jgi:pantetheine-phosphate adenylyltransferase
VIAVYPGSFDPITLGHVDIIQRASRLYDRLIVAVAVNGSKTPLFTALERVEQIRQAVQHLPNVETDTFNGLTVTYAKEQNAAVLIRGLRAISDFELELQMAHTNKTLSNHVETVFLATSNEYSFLSSSVVREIAKLEGPLDHLVQPHITRDLRQRFARA